MQRATAFSINRWISTLSVSMRVALLTLLPLFFLITVLGFYWVTAATINEQLLQNRADIRASLKAKLFRDRLIDTELAIDVFLKKPSAAAASVVKTALDATRDALTAAAQDSPADTGAAGFTTLDTSLANLADDINAIVLAQTDIGFDGASGLGGKVNASGDALEKAVGEDVDNSDPLGIATSESFQKARRGQLQFAITRDSAARDNFLANTTRMGKAIDASFFGADAKAKLTAALNTYVAGFQAWADRVDNLAKTNARANDGFRELAASADALVVAASNSAEDTSAELTAAQHQSLIYMIGAVILAIGLCALFGLLIGRGISRPIAFLASAMRRMAEGNTDMEIEERGGSDEIAAMMKATAIFRNSMIDREQLAAAQLAEAGSKSRRAAVVDKLIRQFEQMSGDALSQVDAASIRLSGAAGKLTQQADQVSGDAGDAKAAVLESAGGISAASHAVHGLAGSIADIADRARQSTMVSRNAVDEAERTMTAMRSLADAAARIDEIVDFIQAIAAQTNLLALNATIEAARAGDAGKGFSVVASEVKNLASQTAKATEDISSQIAAIQAASSGAVDAIRTVNQTVEEMARIAQSVEASVQSQEDNVATMAGEMNRATLDANAGADKIAKVGSAAASTRSIAGEVGELSNSLQSQSSMLLKEVQTFLNEVRAA